MPSAVAAAAVLVVERKWDVGYGIGRVEGHRDNVMAERIVVEHMRRSS